MLNQWLHHGPLVMLSQWLSQWMPSYGPLVMLSDWLSQWTPYCGPTVLDYLPWFYIEGLFTVVL